MIGKLRSYLLDPVLFSARRFLPGSVQASLPPRGAFLHWQDLPSSEAFKYTEIYPEGRIQFQPLACLDDFEREEIKLASDRDDWTNQIRPGFVCSANSGRYCGAGYAVLSARDDLYADMAFPHVLFPSPASHPLMRHPRQQAAIKYHGRCLVLLSGANPYHFLFEVVGRLALAREAGLDPLEFDWILSNQPASPIEMEILTFLRLNFDRFIGDVTKIESHYVFDDITFSNTTYGVPELLCALLRRNLDRLRPSKPRVGLPQLVYLSRGSSYKTRRLLNENAVMACLKRFGFSTLVPNELTYAEQRAVFENARVIISAHGAALANLLWCNPGTSIVEMRSRRHVNGYWKLYWNISSALKLNHYWVNCDATRNTEVEGEQYSDLTIPISRLSKAVEHAIHASGV